MLLGRLAAKERVARILLARAESSQWVGGPDQGFELPMSRAEIADHVGLTTETVSSVFMELRQQGLIECDAARDMILRGRQALSALADGD